jgi:hypothetical protein
MTLYKAYVFRKVPLYFPDIEASTPGEAASIAADMRFAEAHHTEDWEGKSLSAIVYEDSDDDFTRPFHVEFPAEPSYVSPQSTVDVHALLEQRREVTVIWCTEDVQAVRPDLTDDQAWEVLQRCSRAHDCNYGFTWDLIRFVADDLFVAPDTNDKA